MTFPTSLTSQDCIVALHHRWRLSTTYPKYVFAPQSHRGGSEIVLLSLERIKTEEKSNDVAPQHQLLLD